MSDDEDLFPISKMDKTTFPVVPTPTTKDDSTKDDSAHESPEIVSLLVSHLEFLHNSLRASFAH